MSEPLTASMANILAWRLGRICLEAASPDQKSGDYIDRGLILRRLLEEGGFHLILAPEKAEGLDAERGTGAEAVIGRSTP